MATVRVDIGQAEIDAAVAAANAFLRANFPAFEVGLVPQDKLTGLCWAIIKAVNPMFNQVQS